jgi:hypothetical protein
VISSFLSKSSYMVQTPVSEWPKTFKVNCLALPNGPSLRASANCPFPFPLGISSSTSGAPWPPPARQSPPDAGEVPALLISCSLLPHTSQRRPATLMCPLMLPWFELVGVILPFCRSSSYLAKSVAAFQFNSLVRTQKFC